MQTTTVRVYEQTREKLKKISGIEKVSITNLLDKLVKEYEKSFWEGFDSEAKVLLNKKELKLRTIFEKTIKDGFSK
ncbi:MAG: hypothetical protein M1381_09890 [Deltaproteobacteria bacterium]|nr:hypothetical protein [Deltaproteobacteria bacterium]